MATAQSGSLDESHCVLCCDDIEFSACGSCDHPICIKCCVKLRLLRKENDCPVCRAQLKEVVVSKGYKSWAEKSFKPKPEQAVRNHGIYHENRECKHKMDELLDHKCPECGQVFVNFSLVKDHVRKTHNCYYCDICLKHLRLFTHERKCYTREALVRHRKEGDPDDKSHRGHPLCKFCDERYLDNDELLLHLRKNHFWCHLCEKDGCQDYYPSYKELRKHFLQSHFLCEEGECVHEKLTNVFRRKVDYQAHLAQKHSDRMSKAESRQVRQLDVDIRFNPRQSEPAGIISGRDYSFPEQRSERSGGRRLGNRDRAGQNRSAFEGRDSSLREASDLARHGRHKGRDRDGERAHRIIEQDKRRDRDNERVAKGSCQDNVKSTDGTGRDSAPDKRRDRDNERVAKRSYQDNVRSTDGTGRDSAPGKRRDKDNERVAKGSCQDNVKSTDGTGRDNAPDKRRDKKYERTPIDHSHARRGQEANSEREGSNLERNSKEGPHDRHRYSGVSDNGEETGTKVKTKNKGNVSEANLNVKDKAKNKKELEGHEPTPDLENRKHSKPSTSKSITSSSRPKPEGLGYHDDFPTLSKTGNSVVPGHTANPVPNYEEQYPKVSNKNKPVASSSVERKLLKGTYHDEFPTLSASSDGHNKPNSTMKVPPGLPFPGLHSTQQAPIRAPPGLRWNAPLSWAMPAAPSHRTPENSDSASNTRNRKLIKDIQHMLEYRGQSFPIFQKISGQFRNGLASAESYYEQCCHLLGEENFHKVFRELIDLLPDEEKQRQLLLVYNDAKVRAKQTVPTNIEACRSSDPGRGENDPLPSQSIPLHDKDFPALPMSSGKKTMKSQPNVRGAWVRGR